MKVNPVNVTTLRESDPRGKEIQKKSPQRDTQFFKKKNLCLNVPRKKWMFWSHVRETDISKQDTWHLGKGVSDEWDIRPDKRWLVPKAQVKTDFAAFSEFPRPSASFYFFIFGHSTWHVGSSSLSRDWTHAPCIGNTGSWPQEPQGSSPFIFFKSWFYSSTTCLQKNYPNPKCTA